MPNNNADIRRISIRIHDDIDMVVALEGILRVVKGGRVSNHETAFCACSIWKDEIGIVSSTHPSSFKSSDSFGVYPVRKG